MNKVFRIGVGVVASLVLMAGFIVMQPARAQFSSIPTTAAPCPTGLTINITTTTALRGIVPLYLGVPTTTTATTSFNIDRVIFMVNGLPIGEGRRQTTTPSAWFMRWATQLGEQGNRNLNAYVMYNGTQACMTPQMSVMVANPTTATGSEMTVQAMPAQWSGLTSTSIDINTQLSLSGGEIPDTELAQFAYFEWSTDIGSLTSARGIGRFSSGGVAGNGRIRIEVSYAG